MKIIRIILALISLLSLCLCSFVFETSAVGALDVSAKAACLIEAESGTVLYEKSASRRMPMASTTKIMTAILALESGISLDTVVRIPPEAVGVEGSSLYLKDGERLSFEQLLYGLLLCSANDAATAIAITVGGSVDKFVAQMNEKARALGLNDTHFTNPHGLGQDGHYTSALDLAQLMAYCVKNEAFLAISGCIKRVFPKEDDGVRVMINHNRLLREDIGVISGKTGFTKASGRCLVSCAERDGLRLIAVTLSAPNDWSDHTRLYEFGFSNYKRANFSAISLKIPVISGKKGEIQAKSEDISLFLPQNCAEIEIRVEAPRFVFADVFEGEQIGRVLYLRDGKVVASSPIIALESAEKMQKNFNLFEWLKDFIKGLFS